MLTKDRAKQVESLWVDPRGERGHSKKIATQQHSGPRLRYAVYAVLAILCTAAWAYDPKNSFPILFGFAILVFLMVALERGIGRHR